MKIESDIQGWFYAMSVTNTIQSSCLLWGSEPPQASEHQVKAPWAEFSWESAQPVAMQSEIHLRNAIRGDIMVVKPEHRLGDG